MYKHSNSKSAKADLKCILVLQPDYFNSVLKSQIVPRYFKLKSILLLVESFQKFNYAIGNLAEIR